ncbi:hypothetical protein L7F22_052199 [Adiantum nelumboides]|nr:hypothetical protein [Adiantum nelumboides]
MDEMYKKVKVALEKTQAKQKKTADRHRCEVVFSVGDWVLLRFEKARLKKMKGKERLFPKLRMRYYGLFQVYDKISDVAYRLKLPENWKIHNAFHVSLLRPYVGDVPEDIPAEEEPKVEKLNKILVPEQILAHKERKVKGKVILFSPALDRRLSAKLYKYKGGLISYDITLMMVLLAERHKFPDRTRS